ncbi:zinc ribbon domain-containing protein [Staphylococcus simulans]
MKYCTNCGKKLEPDELFCTNCGAKVPQKDRRDAAQPTNHTHMTQSSKQKLSKGWIIVISLIILILVAALIFAISHFMSVREDNDKKAVQNDTTQEHKKTSKQQTKTVKVEVNSDDFSANFMNADNTSGYKGFHIGARKKAVEESFGKSKDNIDINGNEAYQYGNIAVSYDNNNKVDHVFVVPTDVTTREFTDFHNVPDEKRGDTWYYDKNKDNDYTLKVYTNGQYIVAIENIDQI